MSRRRSRQSPQASDAVALRWGELQRQPCSAASQPQLQAQAHAWVATSGVDGVELAWQPQRQLEPGQSTHWHVVDRKFMKISWEVEGRTRRIRGANSGQE